MDDAEFEANQAEIDRLKTEISASTVPRRSGWSRVRKWLAEISLMVGIMALLLGGLGWWTGIVASRQAKANCGLDRSVAEEQLPPNISTFGLNIAAQSRHAYYAAGCAGGRLAPAPALVISFAAMHHINLGP